MKNLDPGIKRLAWHKSHLMHCAPGAGQNEMQPLQRVRPATTEKEIPTVT